MERSQHHGDTSINRCGGDPLGGSRHDDNRPLSLGSSSDRHQSHLYRRLVPVSPNLLPFSVPRHPLTETSSFLQKPNFHENHRLHLQIANFENMIREWLESASRHENLQICSRLVKLSHNLISYSKLGHSVVIASCSKNLSLRFSEIDFVQRQMSSGMLLDADSFITCAKITWMRLTRTHRN